MTFENTSKLELPGHKIYKKDINLSTFTLSDIQEIAVIRATADENKLYKLIDRKLHGISVEELSNQDLEYILHWQRINSYSHFPIELKWDCPGCDNKNTSEITGNDLVISNLEEDYKDFVSLKLFSLDEDIKVRLSTVGDNMKVKSYMISNDIEESDLNKRSTLTLAMQLEPNGGSLEDRIQLVDKLSPDDYLLIKEFESIYDFGVKPYVEKECFTCGRGTKVGFKFTLDKFFPDLPNRPNLRDRILSNKPSVSEGRRDGLSKGSVDEKSSHKVTTGSRNEKGSVKVNNSKKVANLKDIVNG